MKSVMADDEYEDAPEDITRAVELADKNDAFMSLDELLARSKKQRVTLNVDSDIVDEFRDIANKHNAKYQTLMNEVLRDGLKRLGKKRLGLQGR